MLDLEVLLSAAGANRTPGENPLLVPFPQSCSNPKSRGGNELEAIKIKVRENWKANAKFGTWSSVARSGTALVQGSKKESVDG
jgi:hypothetical protein